MHLLRTRHTLSFSGGRGHYPSDHHHSLFRPLYGMEMLRLLTHKLRQQSLSEAEPAIESIKAEEEKDSGTESDEENAELEALEKEMKSSSPSLPSPPPSASYSPNVAEGFYLFRTLATSPDPQPRHRDIALDDSRSDQSSTRGSLDFDQSGSDYDQGNWTDGEAERHSSEEELAVINSLTNNNNNNHIHHSSSGASHSSKRGQLHAEKRKWSQVTSSHSCHYGNDSAGSSDEEVEDLLSQKPQPVLFSSAPPRGVRRCVASPRYFLANVTPCTICTVSPRKRHRQISTNDVSEANIQRPCLDFEKMQMLKVTLELISPSRSESRNSSTLLTFDRKPKWQD